jgi:hypothetical protein
VLSSTHGGSPEFHFAASPKSSVDEAGACRSMMSCLRKWSNTKLRQGLERWIDVIVDDQRADAMLRCLHRMVHSHTLFAQFPKQYGALAHCYSAWLQWREVIRHFDTAIDAMAVYLRRMTHMRYRVSCLKWCEAVEVHTHTIDSSLLGSQSNSSSVKQHLQERRLKEHLLAHMQQSGAQVLLYCLRRLKHGALIWSLERWLAVLAVLQKQQTKKERDGSS